jgi:hypothetical protein
MQTRESHAAVMGCPLPLAVTDAAYRMLKVSRCIVHFRPSSE